MPDISKCNGEKCPKREYCYRYRATPNKYGQSYSMFEEQCLKNSSYDNFWYIGDRKDITKED